MNNFPASSVVDVIISYLQYVFGNADIVPAEYRWLSDDRASMIRIGGAFVIDNEKPMSAPFIVVERGNLVFANNTINNLKSADANTFENPKFTDWMNGSINIIVGSGVASEASSLANFIAIMIQANRHGIMDNSAFIRNLNYVGLGPEIPVVKFDQVKRWEVTLSLSVSLQIGWLKSIMEPVLWTKAAFYQTKNPPAVYSNKGVITLGSDILVDTTQNFGYLSTNEPQLLQTEFDKGWYYIRFKDNENEQLYTIVEIVDNNTLRLQTHDVDNNQVSWAATKSATDVEYDLLWNHLNIHMELPTK